MDKKSRNKKITVFLFAATFVIIVGIFVAILITTKIYNQEVHQDTIVGDRLFTTTDDNDSYVSVRVEPRSNTWTKQRQSKNIGDIHL